MLLNKIIKTKKFLYILTQMTYFLQALQSETKSLKSEKLMVNKVTECVHFVLLILLLKLTMKLDFIFCNDIMQFKINTKLAFDTGNNDYNTLYSVNTIMCTFN